MTEQRESRQNTVRLGDIFEVTQRLQDEALDWYRVNYVPSTMRHLRPAMLKVVQRACGGDWRRCVYDPADESITIYNKPVWVPERDES
jgi:hypothetical protein